MNYVVKVKLQFSGAILFRFDQKPYLRHSKCAINFRDLLNFFIVNCGAQTGAITISKLYLQID